MHMIPGLIECASLIAIGILIGGAIATYAICAYVRHDLRVVTGYIAKRICDEDYFRTLCEVRQKLLTMEKTF
jgi:hypothetical protein